jgi:hypothetical protein
LNVSRDPYSSPAEAQHRNHLIDNLVIRSQLTGNHGGANSASGETNQDTDFRMRHEVAGKDRERVRTAHGNYSQRESEQAPRVWQACQDPGGGKPNRTHFEVYAERPADSTLLLSSIQGHQQRSERIPRMVAADVGFYSLESENAGQELGVR